MRLRWLPSSLFARLALILLAGLLAAQWVSFWLQSDERAVAVSQARGMNFSDRIVEAVRVLEAAPAPQREATIAALQSAALQVRMIGEDQVSPHAPQGQIRMMIAARLGSEREIRSPGGQGGMGHHQRASPARSFDVRLSDGQWVRITATLESDPPALSSNLVVRLLLTLLIVLAVVMLALRQLSQPLQTLAQAADKLGYDLDAPPLAEQGSTETRRAAQAFNRMQGRIKRLIDERSRALAAVSHDLRTPLTRLRLRAELVEDDDLREQMAADMDGMAAMLDATLDYLRGLQETEPPRRIDMNALLQSLAEDAALLGKDVQVAGSATTPYTGRLTALRRALQNLIDNAIKYGQHARIRLEDSPEALRLVVEDDGPGIPPEQLGRVTEPYYRVDASRNSTTGGMGLGLSIVKDIALLHGGELLLANRAEGGLRATLVLPHVSPDRTLNPA